jgi:hypothetical protein
MTNLLKSKCLRLAKRSRREARLPESLFFASRGRMTLRLDTRNQIRSYQEKATSTYASARPPNVRDPLLPTASFQPNYYLLLIGRIERNVKHSHMLYGKNRAVVRDLTYLSQPEVRILSRHRQLRVDSSSLDLCHSTCRRIPKREIHIALSKVPHL